MDPSSNERVLTTLTHQILGTEVEIKPAFTAKEAFDLLVSKKHKKLYLPLLPDECTEEIIMEHFQQFGEIETQQFLSGPSGAIKRKFGFITFYESKSLENALSGSPMHFIEKIGQKVFIFR